jgi:hypothetical protein
MKTTIRRVFQNGILILCNCSRYGGRQQRVRRTSYNVYDGRQITCMTAAVPQPQQRQHNSIIS